MKKFLVLASILLVLTLVFVACTGEAETQETTGDSATVTDAGTVADTAADSEDATVADTVASEQPTVDSEEPGDSSEEPGDSSAEPGDSSAEPGDSSEEPGDSSAEPGDSSEEPTEEPTEAPTEPVDPDAPVSIFQAAEISTIIGGDPNNLTQDCVSVVENYLHIVPIGPDPYYYPFMGVDGARYVAIRYRTDATGADIQFYISSTGSGPQNDDTMLQQPVIADSQWHVIVIDTQPLIDEGLYDGEYVSYFRFDPLEAGYMLDENGEKYYLEGTQTYARYSLPEGCMIDVEYVAFFHSEEAAMKYNYELYPDEKPAEPEYYDNYNVPQDQWVITGHREGIQTSADGMVAAGGVESGALLHQGAIYVGDLDLSKYSKVIVYYGIDNSDVTWGRYNESAVNRIMLSSADTHMTNAPADENVIAGATYEPSGWAVIAFEIDLTDVDYNGPVYVTYDTLPGTFMLISAVEFIGAEKPAEPEAPAGPVVIAQNDPASTVKHISHDEMRFLDGDMTTVVGQAFEPGQYTSFNGVVNYTQGSYPFIADWGWIAVDTADYQFGYIVDGGDPIMNADYTVAAEDPVKQAAAGTGASNASRYLGVLAVVFLQPGEHNIKFVMQQNGAEYVIIREYTIIVTAA